MRFAHPLYLWGLLLLPLSAIALAVFFARRRRVFDRLGDHALVERMIASSSPRRRRAKLALQVLALGLVVTALARPQLGSRATLSRQFGLDVVVALDVSRSMLARDVYPSRLERAKRELDNLLDELVGDRVGTLAFAGETIAYPLTLDFQAVRMFARSLTPNEVPAGGTSLARVLRAGTDMLRRVRGGPRRAQVMVLMTDGEDTTGEPLAAAREAAAEGIRVYTIGIGTPAGELIPQLGEGGRAEGFVRNSDGDLVTSKLDEARLRRIAEVTGGDYFRIDPKRFGVDAVRLALANLQRAEHEARVVRRYDEGYAWFLFPAFMLLLLEAVTGDRRRSAAPSAPAAALLPQAARAGVLLALLPMLLGFDLLLAPDPDVEEGNRALSEGRARDALVRYERALTRLPAEPGLRLDRGAALYALGRFEEAQREFLRATEARDQALKAQGFYSMGNAFFRAGKYVEAQQAYVRALGLEPRDVAAKWNLELALRAGAQKEEARRADEARREAERQAEQERRRREEEERKRREAESQAQGSKDAESPGGGPPERPMTTDEAEAVLDALSETERTLEQELARRRAAEAPRVERDW